MTQEILAKVKGEADYARDRLERDLLRGECLLVGLLRSPHPHARIQCVDVSRALRVRGVKGVLTGDDFAGIRLGHVIADQPVLAVDRVRYMGEPVVAVAAETVGALRSGLGAVRVSYGPLPSALTPEEALTLEVPIHEERPDNIALSLNVERGDWEHAARRAEVWAEGEFTVQPAQHAYMEPYAVLAKHAGNTIILCAPMHSPHMILEEYRSLLRDWEEGLEIEVPTIGGSFGAKYEHPVHVICAEFARRLRRDVGMVMSRREDFAQATPRVNLSLWVRIGASRDGQLITKESRILANNGAYSLHAPSVVRAATIRMDNLYKFEAVRAQAKLVYTNTVPTQCFRGFGSPQSAFAQEQILDELARKLGIGPGELRKRNAVGPGEVSVHGWKIGSCGLGECVDVVERAIARDRVEGGGEGGETSAPMGERWRTGYGVACGTHVISNRAVNPAGDFSVVRMIVTDDGRVRVSCGEVDVGGGTATTLRRIVAGILNIKESETEVILGVTAGTPFGLGSFASRTTFFAGNAALSAARRLRENVARVRQELGLDDGAPLDAVAAAAAEAGRLSDLEAEGVYIPPGVELPDDSWKGNVSPAYTFAAHGCRVRVDTWTGLVLVERYWAAHDAGRIINPVGAEGQVYGGVLQGLGYALSEGAIFSERGVENPGFLDYRVPTAADAVPVEAFFVSTEEEAGPLGAKTIAELPIIPVAACVANAIYDATGWRVRRLPMEPETVLRAGRPEVLDDHSRRSCGPTAAVVLRE
ncbi:MAG: xanthine dehydrogenase family protein molybdopterin-binding subunit [Armatimonadota bacterium]|nr:xanthine dehydrogenase family protein molybdopterin-binding subunit [Armatimonadota bacterium]